MFNKRLSDREYLVGPDYSIADIASYPWIVPWQQGQSLEDFPHLTRWFEAISEREAVARAYALVAEVNPAAHVPVTDEAKRA